MKLDYLIKVRLSNRFRLSNKVILSNRVRLSNRVSLLFEIKIIWVIINLNSNYLLAIKSSNDLQSPVDL
jgi:hypothetical protein